jgi:hypothetical protein
LQFRGFRRSLELSWEFEQLAIKYAVTGVSVATEIISLPQALAEILSINADLLVKPFGAGQQPSWIARTYESALELSDTKSVLHSDLKLTLVETTLLQSIPIAFSTDYDPEIFYGQCPPSQVELDGYWKTHYSDANYVEATS